MKSILRKIHKEESGETVFQKKLVYGAVLPAICMVSRYSCVRGYLVCRFLKDVFRFETLLTCISFIDFFKCIMRLHLAGLLC